MKNAQISLKDIKVFIPNEKTNQNLIKLYLFSNNNFYDVASGKKLIGKVSTPAQEKNQNMLFDVAFVCDNQRNEIGILSDFCKYSNQSDKFLFTRRLNFDPSSADFGKELIDYAKRIENNHDIVSLNLLNKFESNYNLLAKNKQNNDEKSVKNNKSSSNKKNNVKKGVNHKMKKDYEKLKSQIKDNDTALLV